MNNTFNFKRFGKYLAYDGKPIIVAFHAVSDGHTRSAKDVWGQDIPYLASVESKLDEPLKQAVSKTEITSTQLKEKLGKVYDDITFAGSADSWLKITQTGEYGLVKQISVCGRQIPADELCEALDLSSQSFTFELSGDKFIFTHVDFKPGWELRMNAILRAYVRDDSFDRAHIPADCPPLLRERWTAAYGPERAAAILGQFASNPPISVRLRPGADLSLLADCGPEPFEPDFDTGDFRFFTLKNTVGLFDNPLLQDGSLYVQDPATSMGLCLLESKPSGAILDLCAAPGGKTIMLSELAAPGAKITAADRSRKRVTTLNINLRRAGVKAKTVAADARELPFPPQSFDFILADVPCSNTGVIRRRPDVPWCFSKTRLAELTVLQHAILKSAVSLLKPGGTLLYSTCSLESEENLGRVQLLLSEYPGLTLVREQTLFPSAAHDGAFSAVLKLA